MFDIDSKQRFVAVVGGGLAGCECALALSRGAIDVGDLSPAPNPRREEGETP